MTRNVRQKKKQKLQVETEKKNKKMNSGKETISDNSTESTDTKIGRLGDKKRRPREREACLPNYTNNQCNGERRSTVDITQLGMRVKV